MKEIKGFLKQFWWMFLTIALLLCVWLILIVIRNGSQNEGGYERTNKECDTTERVFDYAGKLTDKEEEKLRALIAKREKQIGCDIVLVTLNKQLSQNIRDYADDFYDGHMYGYDKPWGDGVIYVDNWYDGYTWLSTSGKAEDKYSMNMINALIDDVTGITNENPYKAYERYINDVYRQMSGKSINSLRLPISAVFVLALLFTIVYTATGLSNTKTKRTTGITAYVPAGRPDMGICNDIFVSKHTTRRHIDSGSGGSGGSGGGGHHMSSGGHSHGGGGGHH
ncbi:MAG: TPM domain-containing protein [Roseburia sp.]|nr:TPM domain-containing protein [Roseburia sp.]MCM1280143.1 TPM domain-containing protein [Robinsoniella sp.]